MTTKEAIEFMEAKVCCPILLTMEADEYCSNKNNKTKVKKFEDKVDKIIFLLKRGKKYEQMWGELNILWGDKSSPKLVMNVMQKLYREYFPKEDDKLNESKNI